MHNLAVLEAQDGGAGKPDYAAALDWFKRAAAYGVRDSQFNLGVLYGRGLGATQDLSASWMWFSVAARQGDTDAARKRDEVANRMDGRAMTAAKKMFDAFKAETPNPAVNDPPPAPADAAAGAPAAADRPEGKAAGVKG
jgi:localization factor PodJL